MEFGVVGLDNHHHHHHHNHLHHNHHLHNNNHLHHHGLGVSSSTTNGISSPPSSDPETNKLRRATPYGSDAPGLLSGSAVKQERSAADSALDDCWRSSKLAKTGRDDRDDDRRRDGVGDDDDDDDNIDKRVVFEQRSGSNTGGTGTVTRASTGGTTTLSFLDSNGSYSQPPAPPHHQMLSFSTKSEAHDTFSYFPSSVSAYTTRNSNNSTGYNNGGGIMRLSALSSPTGGGFTASQWMELEHQALIYKYITANVPIPSNLLTPFRNSAAFSSFPAAVLRSNPLGGGWGAFHLGFSNNADPEPGRCRRTDGKKWRCSKDAVADQKYCERHMNRGRQRSRKPVEGHVAVNNNNNNNNNNSNKSSLPATRHHLDINSSSNRNMSGGTLSLLTSSSKETTSTPLFPQKQQQQQIPYVDTSSSPPQPPSTEFGLVTSVDSLLKQPQQSSSSLHHFIDDWPNMDPRTTTRAAATTQLSISIPTANSLSPLRLSNNWGPVSWEATAAGSLGGPLGEALNQPPNSNHSGGNDSKSLGSSVLNLMPEMGGWEGSSPTGVLQKTAFGSLSNSSAGSSPTRAHDLLGGCSSSSLPAAF